MCVIIASPAGVEQPDMEILQLCWEANPHGAGYCKITPSGVKICKGFMGWPQFRAALALEDFRAENPVIYHFRISTQAGVTPAMCHPFPLTEDRDELKSTRIGCEIAVAHNGVIPGFSNGDRKFSDTALYIAGKLSRIIRDRSDVFAQDVQAEIRNDAPGSRFAFLSADGEIATVGRFTEIDGNLYSNTHWLPDERPGFYGRQCSFTEIKRWPF